MQEIEINIDHSERLENSINNINSNVNAMKSSLESFENRLVEVEKKAKGGRF